MSNEANIFLIYSFILPFKFVSFWDFKSKHLVRYLSRVHQNISKCCWAISWLLETVQSLLSVHQRAVGAVMRDPRKKGSLFSTRPQIRHLSQSIFFLNIYIWILPNTGGIVVVDKKMDYWDWVSKQAQEVFRVLSEVSTYEVRQNVGYSKGVWISGEVDLDVVL